MITSKALLALTGISRATLNNYIAMDLLPRPEVKRQAPAPGESPATLGYFPDWATQRVNEIRNLKQLGLSIDAIRSKLSGQTAEPAVAATTPLFSESILADENQNHAPAIGHQQSFELKVDLNQSIKNYKESDLLGSGVVKETPQRRGNTDTTSAKTAKPQQGLNLTIEQIDYPAYMINYESHLIWLNDHAKAEFFSGGEIPDRTNERSILPALLNWSAHLPFEEKQQLFAAHFKQVKCRLSEQAFAKTTLLLGEKDRTCLHNIYASCEPAENKLMNSHSIQHKNADAGRCQLIAISFREGVLMVYLPEDQEACKLLDWLSQRDAVIRSLLNNRLPVLTLLAVMVADLQNSVHICSELPPEEYFDLINQIWSTLNPIFRDYYGVYGKHTGDGMVYYFFPQPDRNHLMSVILCAGKVRDIMKKISHEWAVKKGWDTQLYMNIGLSEGEEWLGTFKTDTNYELVVLGETINISARLSDFARFGRIWATKNLVSKLSPSERAQIEYGIQRSGVDQEVFIENTYAQVGTLHAKDDPRALKLKDITSCAVTEIRHIKTQ